MALDYLTEVIAELYDNPGMFENIQRKLKATFVEFRGNNFVLSNAVEMIFEQVSLCLCGVQQTIRSNEPNSQIAVNQGAKLPLHGRPPLPAAGQPGRQSVERAAAAAEHEDGAPAERAAHLPAAGADQGARHHALPGRAVHAAAETARKFAFCYEIQLQCFTL